MYKFLLELKGDDQLVEIYTYEIVGSEMNICRFKGENYFELEADNLEEYWKTLSNTKALVSDADINITVVAKEKKLLELLLPLKEFISKQVAVTETFQCYCKFFKEQGTLYKGLALRKIDKKEMSFTLENTEKKLSKLYYASIGGLDFERTEPLPEPKPIQKEVIKEHSEVKKSTVYSRKRVQVEEKKVNSVQVINKPEKNTQSLQESMNHVKQAEYCDEDLFNDYLEKTSKKYCTEVDYDLQKKGE